jgi:hypothetical protein
MVTTMTVATERLVVSIARYEGRALRAEVLLLHLLRQVLDGEPLHGGVGVHGRAPPSPRAPPRRPGGEGTASGGPPLDAAAYAAPRSRRTPR